MNKKLEMFYMMKIKKTILKNNDKLEIIKENNIYKVYLNDELIDALDKYNLALKNVDLYFKMWGRE